MDCQAQMAMYFCAAGELWLRLAGNQAVFTILNSSIVKNIFIFAYKQGDLKNTGDILGYVTIICWYYFARLPFALSSPKGVSKGAAGAEIQYAPFDTLRYSGRTGLLRANGRFRANGY
jgi:hypothetical protein